MKNTKIYIIVIAAISLIAASANSVISSSNPDGPSRTILNLDGDYIITLVDGTTETLKVRTGIIDSTTDSQPPSDILIENGVVSFDITSLGGLLTFTDNDGAATTDDGITLVAA